MRRSVVVLGAVLVVGLLGLAIALPVAARGMWWQGATPGGAGATPATATITMQQARDRVTQYLSQAGLANLKAGEVMQFSNQFYVEVLDPATGNGAFEMLVSLDGQAVHPEPSMMWNTQYNPMLGTAGAGLHQGMMGGANGYGGYGMMGSSSSAFGTGVMGGGHGYGMIGGVGANGSGMGYQPNTGSQLAQPLTAETALARVQAWLDQNRPGVTAADPTAFPGYFTFHTEQGGKITGMLSVQATTGAIWEHSWHGSFIAMDSGAQ